MDCEGSGLLRLSIMGVDPADVGKYSCKIFNPYGEDICHAELSYDCMSSSLLCNKIIHYFIHSFNHLMYHSNVMIGALFENWLPVAVVI